MSTTSIKFTDLKAGYEANWLAMCVRPEKVQAVASQAAKVKANKARYDEVVAAVKKVAPASQIPWYFVGLVHLMECTLSFNHHLHNGDPLTKRTVHVPVGRPVKGKPPFTFLESAVDALLYQELEKETDWSIAKMLWRSENYNGMGYRLYHAMASPYLWAGSNLYSKGKYTLDGKFDPSAVSDQIGVALILKQILI